jgi:hypothetical protein
MDPRNSFPAERWQHHRRLLPWDLDDRHCPPRIQPFAPGTNSFWGLLPLCSTLGLSLLFAWSLSGRAGGAIDPCCPPMGQTQEVGTHVAKSVQTFSYPHLGSQLLHPPCHCGFRILVFAKHAVPPHPWGSITISRCVLETCLASLPAKPLDWEWSIHLCQRVHAIGVGATLAHFLSCPQHLSGCPERQRPAGIAGLHLAGGNAHLSAMEILSFGTTGHLIYHSGSPVGAIFFPSS